jgi:ribosome-associated protein
LPAKSQAPDHGADPQAQALHDLVLRSLDDDKAVEVVSIPLAGKSNIADHMVIASGRSTRQVASMADKLTERIKRELGRTVRVEGLPVADWVLIDAGDDRPPVPAGGAQLLQSRADVGVRGKRARGRGALGG